MTPSITIRTSDRVYREDRVNRIGSIKRFITKKTGGRPHCYAVVNVYTRKGVVEEHWRLTDCRLAD